MRCPVLDCLYHGSFHDVRQHLESSHPQVGGSAASSLSIYPFVEIRAFRGYLRTYQHRHNAGATFEITNGQYLENVRTQLQRIIEINTDGLRCVKVQLSTLCEFERGELGSHEVETCTHYINSRLPIIDS